MEEFNARIIPLHQLPPSALDEMTIHIVNKHLRDHEFEAAKLVIDMRAARKSTDTHFEDDHVYRIEKLPTEEEWFENRFGPSSN